MKLIDFASAKFFASDHPDARRRAALSRGRASLHGAGAASRRRSRGLGRHLRHRHDAPRRARRGAAGAGSHAAAIAPSRRRSTPWWPWRSRRFGLSDLRTRRSFRRLSHARSSSAATCMAAKTGQRIARAVAAVLLGFHLVAGSALVLLPHGFALTDVHLWSNTVVPAAAVLATVARSAAIFSFRRSRRASERARRRGGAEDGPWPSSRAPCSFRPR